MSGTGLVLRLYPPAFRERYADELDALVHQLNRDRRRGLTADLLRGAVAAWCRPPMPADPAARTRRRTQATVSAVWVAWCAGVVVAPAVTRALTDPEAPGVGDGVRHWLLAGQVLTAIGCVLAAAGALPLGLATVSAARRRRDRVTLGMLAVPLAAGGLALAGLVAVDWATTARPDSWQPSRGMLVVVVVWAAWTALTVAAVGLVPAAVVTRVRPDQADLRLPLLLAPLLTGCLVGATVCSLAAAVAAGGDLTETAWPAVPLGLPLLVAAAASVAAVVSAGRGVAVLNGPRG